MKFISISDFLQLKPNTVYIRDGLKIKGETIYSGGNPIGYNYAWVCDGINNPDIGNLEDRLNVTTTIPVFDCEYRFGEISTSRLDCTIASHEMYLVLDNIDLTDLVTRLLNLGG